MPRVKITDLERNVGAVGKPRGHNEKDHALLRLKLEEARAFRNHFELDWILNKLFFAGEQWISWNHSLNVVTALADSGHNVRAVYNKFKPLLHERSGRMLRQRGEFGVIPSSADPEDKARAAGDEQWLKYIWRTGDMEEKWAELSHWVVTAGNGGVKVFWDDGAGKIIEEEVRDAQGQVELEEDCPTCRGMGLEGVFGGNDISALLAPPCPECNGFGGLPKIREAREGDVNFEVVSPFDLYWDPGAKSAEDAEYVIERSILSVQEARRRFPKAAKFITEDSTVRGFDLGLSFVHARQRGHSISGHTTMSNRVEIFTAYMKPSTAHPDGRVYRFTQKFMIEQFDNPFPKLGFHPFIWFIDFPRGGSIYGQSMGDDLRPLQVTLNRLYSQFLEYVNLILAPPLLVPFGALLAGDKDPARPGRRFDYDPHAGGAPDFLTPPPLPGNIFDIIQKTEQVMDNVAMRSQEAPASQTSGRLEALRQEREDKANTYQITKASGALRKMGRHALSIAKQMYTEDRSIAILGSSNQTSFAVLHAETDPTSSRDVYITANNAFPDSKIERFELVTKQLAPFIVDPDTGVTDFNRILELLEVGSPDLDEDRGETQKAVGENLEMVSTGQSLPTFQFENHRTHFKEHVRKAVTYDNGSPEQQALLPHITEHFQALQAAQMNALQMSQQQITGGTTPTGEQTPGFEGQLPTSGSEQGVLPGAGARVQQADRSGEALARMMSGGQ